MRIAHLADVHIRGLSRHEEYRRVFELFAEDAKAQNVDIIFVGGDIFHTKTSGITPEYIDFMRWWLTRLSEVAPLHMILGNHDGNLTNASRQDAINPIVETLNNPRVFLYKQSGVYEFAPGFNWCVFSLFDEEGYERVKPVEGKVNIACYHGGVRNSVTETDWKIDEGPDLPFFEPYQLALLGDIHRMQFLGTRGEKPWIAYPGTAVCQNYAEESYKHGYLLWDIGSDGTIQNVVHREIEQPNPHCTIDWKGTIEEFRKDVVGKKEGSRFRVRTAQYIAQDDYKRISDILKHEKKAQEVVFKHDHDNQKDVFSAGGLEMMRDDLRNVEVQMLLLKDFYRDSTITAFEWEKVADRVTKYLQAATQGEETPRGIKWSLKELSFDNLFTYGKDNLVNFEKLRGIVGVFGPNRVGKSSIVGAVMYGLYNASDRGAIKNLHIVNARKGFGEARLKFIANGIEYQLTRETNKTDTRKGDTVAATALDLRCYNEDGSKTIMNGEARTDTEKSVRKLIGSQDDFLLTSMSTQGDLTRFINEGSSFRKLILTKFLDLDVFEKMYVAANKDVSATTAALRTTPVKKWEDERKSLQSKLTNYEEFLNRVHVRLESLRTESQELQVQIALHQNVMPVSQEIVERCKLRIKHLELTRTGHYDTEARLTNEMADLREKLAVVSATIASYDSKALEAVLASGQTLRSTIATLKMQLKHETSNLEALKKSIKKLDVVPCGDKFPTCMFIKDSHTDKGKLAAQEERVKSLEEAVRENETTLAGLAEEDVQSKLAALRKAQSTERELSDKLAKTELAHSRVEGDLKDASTALAAEQEKLSDLESSLKKNESLGLIALRSKAAKIQEEVKKFDGMRLEAATSKGKVESDLFKLDEQERKWTQLMGELRIFELIANAFSKRGIPTRIINSQLPAINAEIRDILQGVVEYTVELVADEESNAMEVYLNYGDSKRLIELGSGMEKMFAALAIRVALHKVTTLPKTDIFVLDEGFGVLDETNIEACNRLLVTLKKHFRAILVITHVDAVKDVADVVIEITRNEKDSKVHFE